MSEPAPSTEAPIPPEAPPPGWWRSAEDRYLAGVAGGLGERLLVDPLFVRLGLVVATLVGAAGDGGAVVPALYAAAWLALPTPGDRSLLKRLRRDDGARREAAGVLVLLVATAALLPRLGPGGSPTLRAGVVLVGLAVLLLADRRNGDLDGSAPGPSVTTPERHSPEGPPTTPTGAEGFETAATETAGTETAAPGATSVSAGSARRRGRWQAPAFSAPTLRRRPTRPGPSLWPLTLALLVVYAVACVAVDRLSSDGLSPGVAVSGALLVVAVVLLVSAWRGRARSTVVIGLALLPAWVGFAVSGVPRFEGTGDRFLRPASAEEAADGYELGYGRLVVDLRDVDLQPGEVLRTGVAVTAGLARVVVPADTNLVVMGPVGLGVVRSNPYRRWEQRNLLAVDRTLDWRYGPQPRQCQEQLVPVDGLSFSDASFASVDALAAELRRRGWDAPRPSALAPEAPRVATEPAFTDVPAGEAVLVGVDDSYRLCDASLPAVPDDPATIVLRVELGLANLEVSRVQPN